MSRKLSLGLLGYCGSATLVAGILYSYSTLTWVEVVVGILLLGASAAFLLVDKPWRLLVHRHPTQSGSLGFGLALGLLWLMEITMNNVLQPPLPGRDLADNAFWILISALTIGYSALRSASSGHISSGVSSGFLVGSASGLVACAVALTFVVFGMGFLASDPVNNLEWSGIRSKEAFGSMEKYLAFETLTGGYLHFAGLGALGGILLGAVGAVMGYLGRKVATRPSSSR